MNDYFCLDCDFTWVDLDHEGCPNCQSLDVVNGGQEDNVTDWDGHFEGGFHPNDLEDRGE